MVTLVSIALAALLWLLHITLGTDPGVYGPLKPEWVVRAALGLSVLAGVLTLRRLFGYVLLGWGGNEKKAASGLLQAVTSIVLYAVAAMLYLSLGLGLDISRVLATSAILSVIIGLALQPTLGNLFAGVSIEIERPLRQGDFVRRDAIEGQVVSLNWRSVYLQTERGTTVVLPNNELNSRLVEVIPAGRPYRHQVDFNVGSELPPGHIMRVATQVLCSGLPGICETPSPSVVLLGTDAVTGTLRYAARLYTLQYLDRASISSGFLERLWYVLSREKLPSNAWWPNREVDINLAGRRQEPEALARSLDSTTDDADPVLTGHGTQEGQRLAAPVVAAFSGISAELQRVLLSSAQTLHYGPFERCDSAGVSLVLQGRLTEERPIGAQQAQTSFLALMNEIEQAHNVTGHRRLSMMVYQDLLREGTLALGPLAHDLCQRISTHTADPHMAYRAFAESIPQSAQRARFLARAPSQPNRAVGEGDWLGWAFVLGLEPALLECRASHGCTLLKWSPAVLRTALHAARSEELEALTRLLSDRVPGCEGLNTVQLQSWVHRA